MLIKFIIPAKTPIVHDAETRKDGTIRTYEPLWSKMTLKCDIHSLDSLKRIDGNSFQFYNSLPIIRFRTSFIAKVVFEDMIVPAYDEGRNERTIDCSDGCFIDSIQI
jgi:hypothetical protein